MSTPLPWLRSHWNRIQQLRIAGRLPHALLLSGPRGVGKNRFSDDLCMSLLCRAIAADSIACGACHDCRLYLAGNHPDLLRVAPDPGSKAIKIDQVRELCEFLHYTRYRAAYKIVVMQAAANMNLHAANSLLKTLEEPPAASLLILNTDVPGTLPATVRSRCQNLSFAIPASAIALDWLRSQLSAHDAELCLALAAGAPLDALEYAQQDRLQCRQTLFQCYQALIWGRADPVQAAQTWAQYPADEYLNWLLGWYTDMIRLRVNAAPPCLRNPDLQTELRALAAPLSAQELFRQRDTALHLYMVRATQVNMTTLLEAFFCDCADAHRNKINMR